MNVTSHLADLTNNALTRPLSKEFGHLGVGATAELNPPTSGSWSNDYGRRLAPTSTPHHHHETVVSQLAHTGGPVLHIDSRATSVIPAVDGDQLGDNVLWCGAEIVAESFVRYAYRGQCARAGLEGDQFADEAARQPSETPVVQVHKQISQVVTSRPIVIIMNRLAF